jgi:hypothetical protein
VLLAATFTTGPSSSSSNSAGSGASAAAGPSNSSSSGVVVAGARRRLSSSSPGGGAGGSAAAAVDAAYFDSYSYADIHHDMLADKVRGVRRLIVLTGRPGGWAARAPTTPTHMSAPLRPPHPHHSLARRHTRPCSRATLVSCLAPWCWMWGVAPASCPCLLPREGRQQWWAWTPAAASQASRARWGRG